MTPSGDEELVGYRITDRHLVRPAAERLFGRRGRARLSSRVPVFDRRGRLRRPVNVTSPPLSTFTPPMSSSRLDLPEATIAAANRRRAGTAGATLEQIAASFSPSTLDEDDEIADFPSMGMIEADDGHADRRTGFDLKRRQSCALAQGPAEAIRGRGAWRWPMPDVSDHSSCPEDEPLGPVSPPAATK